LGWRFWAIKSEPDPKRRPGHHTPWRQPDHGKQRVRNCHWPKPGQAALTLSNGEKFWAEDALYFIEADYIVNTYSFAG
jgi:hypothetical protein